MFDEKLSYDSGAEYAPAQVAHNMFNYF